MNDDEKAKLYRRIVQQANSFTVVERMRTLGFWPKGEPIPLDPPDEAAERARIEAELAELRKKKSAVKDAEKALAEERSRRWEESKKRRAEAKARKRLEQRGSARAGVGQAPLRHHRPCRPRRQREGFRTTGAMSRP